MQASIIKDLQRYFNAHKYQEIVYTQQELELLGFDDLANYGDLFSDEKDRFIFSGKINTPCSKTYPLIQVADIFSGIHGFTLNRKICASNRNKIKERIVDHLLSINKSIYRHDPHGYLFTGKEENPNFWLFR